MNTRTREDDCERRTTESKTPRDRYIRSRLEIIVGDQLDLEYKKIIYLDKFVSLEQK